MMDIAPWIIVAGVILIDVKVWAIVLEQRRHNRLLDKLLANGP
jgi:hypothetical protein